MYSKQSLGGIATAKKLRKQALDNYYKHPVYCQECRNIIVVKETEKIREVKIRKFCSKSCAAKFNNSHRVKIEHEKPKVLHAIREKIGHKTKKELFSRRKNWQSARSAIQRNARSVYNKSNKQKSCIICGYDKFYDVAHIKSVSSFSDEATISEINDLNNLAALCPNHHYEFDHDLLSL